MRVKLQCNASIAFQGLETLDLAFELGLLLLLKYLRLGRTFGTEICDGVCTLGLRLCFKPADEGIEVFLLPLAHRFAVELDTKYIGLRR